MTTNSLPADAAPSEPLLAGWIRAWTRFWFDPAAPLGLHWMRVLAGLLFLSWLLPVTAERSALFSLDGWVDAQAYREAARLGNNLPVPIGWSLLYVADSSSAAFEALWWGSLAVLVLFTCGVATRVTAVLTWVVVVSFLASPASHADTDYVLGILAFYLMLGYLFLGQWNRPLSPLERLFGARDTSLVAAVLGKGESAPPSYAANLALRLLQVHFAIIIVGSGLHKLQYADWWSGIAFWYPLHPPLATEAPRIAAERGTAQLALFVLSLAGYLALAWQLTFPLFAFRRRLRPLLLAGGAAGGLGLMWLYGEMTFGPLYALGCLSYLTPAEWRWLTDRVARPFERRHAAATASPVERQPRVKASI